MSQKQMGILAIDGIMFATLCMEQTVAETIILNINGKSFKRSTGLTTGSEMTATTTSEPGSKARQEPQDALKGGRAPCEAFLGFRFSAR
jgi:hypothetical protein